MTDAKRPPRPRDTNQLAKWKFKDWSLTETSKKPVTMKMKAARAKGIASMLNNTQHWKSHSRGLNMEVLTRDVNLKIDDLEKEPEIRSRVVDYYRLLKDYMGRRGHLAVIHTTKRYQGIGGPQHVEE